MSEPANGKEPWNGRFKLTLKTVDVVLEDAAGKDIKYILSELSGKDRDGYLTKLGTKMKYDTNGKATGLKDFTGVQSDLLARAMRTEGGIAVPESTIESWPGSVQEALFEKAQELSGLDKAAKEVPNA